MSRLVDLTGRKFGMLTVLGLDHVDKRDGAMWSVQCDCGNLSIKRGRSMQSGDTTSCGCYKPQKQHYGVAARNALYRVYKAGAKKRGYVFDLTLEQFSELTQKNCTYCGAEPDQVTTFTNGYNGQYKYNGIDRLVNTKGYVFDNVVACCGVCNHMKGTMSAVDFLNHIIAIKNRLNIRYGGNVSTVLEFNIMKEETK